MGLRLTWHDAVHMYECHSLADSGYYLKSKSNIVRLVSCLLKSNKGMKDDYLIASGEWHDSLHCPTQEGKLGGIGPLARDLVLLVLLFFPLIFCFPLMMGFVGLTMICSSVVFVDKRHVTPRLSLVNVANLNKVLRSKVFVSKDRQLRAVHLILDFKPILDNFQEVGHAIKAGDPRLHRIDISIPRFLACKDVVPVKLPSQRVLPEAAVPREETASLRLSLEKEIDQF